MSGNRSRLDPAPAVVPENLRDPVGHSADIPFGQIRKAEMNALMDFRVHPVTGVEPGIDLDEPLPLMGHSLGVFTPEFPFPQLDFFG